MPLENKYKYSKRVQSVKPSKTYGNSIGELGIMPAKPFETNVATNKNTKQYKK